MILLDTNVFSAFMRREDDPIVVSWLNSQPTESIWTTAITVFEIRFGIEVLAAGRRRSSLEKAFARALSEEFDGRVLPFDQLAAEASAMIAARQRLAGRSIEIRDLQIAGTAAARKASLATRNIRHFANLGIALINPWER